MLNTDMSMRVNFDDNFDEGRVTCDPNNECPINNITFNIVNEYANDNQKWLTDFAAVFDKLIKTGYNGDELTVFGESTLTTSTTDNPINTISPTNPSTDDPTISTTDKDDTTTTSTALTSTTTTSATTNDNAINTIPPINPSTDDPNISTTDKDGTITTDKSTPNTNTDINSTQIKTTEGGDNGHATTIINTTNMTGNDEKTATQKIMDTLNDYSGILSVIAIIGVILILCIIFCKECCVSNRMNQHQSVPDDDV